MIYSSWDMRMCALMHACIHNWFHATMHVVVHHALGAHFMLLHGSVNDDPFPCAPS